MEKLGLEEAPIVIRSGQLNMKPCPSGLDIKPLSNMTSPDIGASPQVVGGVAPPATSHLSSGEAAGQTSAGHAGAPLELRCTVEDGKSAAFFLAALMRLLLLNGDGPWLGARGDEGGGQRLIVSGWMPPNAICVFL